MRVIAGAARGTRIEAPKSWAGRPTLDRVREALFSILQPHLAAARFLDLFAGSGANGIEALSRGAECAVFVDKDPQAIEAIRRNLAHARLDERGAILRAALPQGLRAVPRVPFHVIFADPPYAYDRAPAVLEEVICLALLDPNGLLVVEHAARTPLPAQVASLKRVREATYGETGLAFYALEKQPPTKASDQAPQPH